MWLIPHPLKDFSVIALLLSGMTFGAKSSIVLADGISVSVKFFFFFFF